MVSLFPMTISSRAVKYLCAKASILLAEGSVSGGPTSMGSPTTTPTGTWLGMPFVPHRPTVRGQGIPNSLNIKFCKPGHAQSKTRVSPKENVGTSGRPCRSAIRRKPRCRVRTTMWSLFDVEARISAIPPGMSSTLRFCCSVASNERRPTLRAPAVSASSLTIGNQKKWVAIRSVGMTATCVIQMGMRRLHIAVNPYTPWGWNAKIYCRSLSNAGPTLVTCPSKYLATSGQK
mmetsp:Transcript_62267/g.147515  ORF Transcript_62267/g.147515 Transcript_62267/m.147515 type:complete len:232 (+) Transcript_62267:91-786(+)